MPDVLRRHEPGSGSHTDGPSQADFHGSFAASIASSIGTVQSGRTDLMTDATTTFTIVKGILIMSVPLGFAAFAQQSISVVMIAMVGRMVGVEQLGATNLSFGLLNATAFAIAAGFCGALETVLSYSFGRDPTSKLYGVYAQRMTFLLLIIAFFVGPILAFADAVLDALGQNPLVVQYTGEFCGVALFGVFPTMLLELLRRYYACQHLNTPLSVSLVISAVLFPVVVWVCIKVFGFQGAPLAWVILMIAMPGSLLVYLRVTGKHRATWGGWSSAALHNWGPLLKLAFPSMAMMLSEWAALEVNSITAGYAPAEELAAFGILYQTSGVLWSIVSGVFIAASVMVGNSLGRRQSAMARRCATLTVAVAMVAATVNVILLFLFRHQVPKLFSSDEKVLRVFPELVKVYLVYHIFDCVQSCMMGVMRGCGMQVVGAIAITIVYAVVGVPLGMILFFNTSMGVKALWLGPAVGVSCVGFPLYCYLLFVYIKWDKLELKADELPSLNTSMDEHLSMISHSDFDEVREHEMSRPGTPGCGRRLHEFSPLSPLVEEVGGGRSPSPLAHAMPSLSDTRGTAPDNLSNASSVSLFHIPQRTMLIAHVYQAPSSTSVSAAPSSPGSPPYRHAPGTTAVGSGSGGAGGGMATIFVVPPHDRHTPFLTNTAGIDTSQYTLPTSLLTRESAVAHASSTSTTLPPAVTGHERESPQPSPEWRPVTPHRSASPSAADDRRSGAEENPSATATPLPHPSSFAAAPPEEAAGVDDTSSHDGPLLSQVLAVAGVEEVMMNPPFTESARPATPGAPSQDGADSPV